MIGGMDEQPQKPGRLSRVWGRTLIIGVITFIFACLACLMPAGRLPDAELFLAGLIVLYAATLIAVCRGWLDFLNDPL